MKRIAGIWKQHWEWIVFAFLAFIIAFFGMIWQQGYQGQQSAQAAGITFKISDDADVEQSNGGTFSLRRRMSTYTIKPVGGEASPYGSYRWKIPDNATNILQFRGSTSSALETGNQVTIEVKPDASQRSEPITIDVEGFNGTAYVSIISFLIKVEFSISEYLGGSLADNGATISKLYQDDAATKRRVLIMEFGKILYVGNNGDDPDTDLQLVFGKGKEATWTPNGNDDKVIKVGKKDDGTPFIQAIGAGKTTLHVSYKSNSELVASTDQIDVYVKPQVKAISSASGPSITVGGVDEASGFPLPATSDSIVLDNHDSIRIQGEYNQNQSLKDRVSWVILRRKNNGADFEPVCDSLGNEGDNPDDATLIPDENGYRIEAKAGIYHILFFPAGTYKGLYDAEVNTRKTTVDPVTLIVELKSPFEDKTIYLSLGSSYQIADALNLPASILGSNIVFQPYDTDSNAIIDVSKDNTGRITAKKLGEAKVRVTVRGDALNIPGIETGGESDGDSRVIIITVLVEDTFSLNISQMDLAEGASIDLYGIIGSSTDYAPERFVWSIEGQGDRFVSLGSKTGRYATITGKKKTEDGKPAVVTLAWTDDNNKTWVASCRITVTDSTTVFKINPDKVKLNVGEAYLLETTPLSGKQNILWVSSDTSIVTVQAQSGGAEAKLNAKGPGEAVITAVNKDNDVYATCIVTVNSPITAISIDKGTSYHSSIGIPYLFFKAVCQPKNATATEMEWTSSDKTVADVDSTGTVTVKKLGTTTISVKPVYNPNSLMAQCVLTIYDDPITSIKTKVSSLNMLKGDTYTADVTIAPVNPTDPTLTWSTNNKSVATVSKAGEIKAVGVGTATIMIEGGKARPALIQVSVADRLKSIAFKEKSVNMLKGEQKKLELTFNPDANTNHTVTFTTSDKSIVTVDKNGNIKAVKEGAAMIIATSEELGTAGAVTCMVTVETPPVLLEDFTLDPLEKTIKMGEYFEITPIFKPSDVSSTDLLFESLDPRVATVSPEGTVHGESVGITYIQCTETVSGMVDMCMVTVETPVKVDITPKKQTVLIDRSFQIKATITPKGIDTPLLWKSSDTKIATVTSSGKVTGKKAGTCTITCSMPEYEEEVTCEVKVEKLRTKLKLNKSSIRMNIGSIYRLKKTITTNNTTKPKVQFTSNNKKVAKVGRTSGNIKAKKLGSAVITAKTMDAIHATAKCRVTVIRRVSSISLNKTYATCYIGKNLKLRATVRPSNATIKKIKWSSSNRNVAAVTGKGKVTAYSAGEAYITVKTTDGSNKKARCLVRVLEVVPTSSILISQSEMTMKRGDSARLTYTIVPHNHSDKVKIASDNRRVATVTNSGKVRAVGTGTATITITADSGITSTATIHVVEMNKSRVRMRQYDTETLLVHGTSDQITWYSGNNRIATVVGGKVTGRGLGTTYVYAYVNGCKMACRVDVVSVNARW